MGRWQRTNPVANAEFIESEGDVEFTTDGTCVNTTEGWREMRVGIFAKCERGESVHPDQWAERKLPKPHASVAFASIEKMVGRSRRDRRNSYTQPQVTIFLPQIALDL